MSIAFENYKKITNQIEITCLANGRNPDDVSILAVSKTKSAEIVQEFLDECKLAQTSVLLGENYVQEWSEKCVQLKGNFRSHFIGHLQSNKAKLAVSLFDVIESVDSLKIAKAINQAAKNQDKIQNIFLQVNVSNDPAKSGFPLEGVGLDLFKELSSLDNISIIGLMTITQYYENPSESLADFMKLAELKETLFALGMLPVEAATTFALSMGMTSDYEYAIQAGATEVRIGTAIFGER